MTATKSNPTIIAKPQPERPWGLYCLGVLALILGLRLVSLHYNATGLFFDEAQYWLWGKEPDLGYFSKPPVLGWTIGLFTYVCGSDSEFCVRLPSPIIHTGTALLIYLGAARLFDARTGFWSAITFATLPGITLSSTLISTDVPLLFLWAGALWSFVRLRDTGTWSSALLLGCFVGIGLMAKYAMVYFFVCAIIYAAVDKSGRRTVLSGRFLASTLIAILLVTPNLWWNFQHKFITASHTSDNIGWRGGELQFGKAAEFLGSQFGVFGPILFAFFLIALVRFLREGWDRSQKFLVVFSLPVLALITFQAVMSKAYANWAAVTYIGATILIADILVNRVPPLWNRLSLSIHTLIFATLSIAVAYSAPGFLTLPDGREPFARLQGWREIATITGDRLDENSYVAVIGSHRHLTAELVYYLRHRPLKVFAYFQPETGKSTIPQDHYQLKRPYRGVPDGPLLLVSTSKNITAYEPYFASITSLGKSQITSGTIQTIWFFALDDYQGSPIEGQVSAIGGQGS